MASIALEELLTLLYVLIDDWYQAEGWRTVAVRTVGKKVKFSDREMLTLMVAHEYLPYAGETQYLAYLRANYGALFPDLLDQSQYNRRAHRLVEPMEALRYWLLRQLGVGDPNYVVLDTKPVPVVGMKRSKARSRFRGKADYGYCAAKQLHYFGYRLVLVVTPDGLPLCFDLVSAAVDERTAAEAVLDQFRGLTVLADKGFVGEHWAALMRDVTHNTVYTPKRANQKQQNPPAFDRLLNRLRERIETTFNSLQNTGRNLERLLVKGEQGLLTRVAAKLAAFTFRQLLAVAFGIDVLTFSISH